MALTESTTLGGIPIEVGARDGKTRTLVWALAFVLAMVISAYVIVPVPFSPVPITLQVLVVLLAGTLMGPWVGAAAMAAYLAIGISGAPVFAGAGAGFACYEDGGGSWGYFFNELVYRSHSLILAYHTSKTGFGGDFVAKAFDFANHVIMFRGLVDAGKKGIVRKRFSDIIKCTKSHGFNSLFYFSIGCYEYYW